MSRTITMNDISELISDIDINSDISISPATVNIKDASTMNTVNVCRDYIKGTIDTIPRCHIDKMIKTLTSNMLRTALGDKNPKVIAYIESCENDIIGMIDSYVRMIYYRRAVVKKYKRKPETKCKHKMKMATNVLEFMDAYYESITDYCIGSIQFEGHTLDIYYGVPIKSKHYSLTCFHTNPESMNQYFFKNLHHILPCDELIDEFLLQLPHSHSQEILPIIRYSF